MELWKYVSIFSCKSEYLECKAIKHPFRWFPILIIEVIIIYLFFSKKYINIYDKNDFSLFSYSY